MSAYKDFPNIRPGDLVSVEIDGVLHTEYYRPPEPPVYPQLTGWRRVLRRLTPTRWRKPLQPIRTDPLSRAQALTAKTLEFVEQLTAEPVKGPWWRRWMRNLQR